METYTGTLRRREKLHCPSLGAEVAPGVEAVPGAVAAPGEEAGPTMGPTGLAGPVVGVAPEKVSGAVGKRVWLEAATLPSAVPWR